MRFSLLCVCLLIAAAAAQSTSRPTPAEPASATVPITLDHNRVIINVSIPQSDGSIITVPAWVDNGDPDFWMTQRVAGLMALSVSCDGQLCAGTANPPGVSLAVLIAGMKILLPSVKEIKIPAGATSIAPGMNAEINIPSTVLRSYDVLIDYPDRKFTIGKPGTIHFNGASTKVQVNQGNGLILVPSQIENKKYNLALDLGSSISLLSAELFEKLASAHPDWPHMTGAIGPANMWGSSDEPNWKLMRLDRVQFGSLHLIDVPAAEFPAEKLAAFEKESSAASGLLGADVFLNYRVGFDYVHSLVYFDIGRMFQFPEFDVVGLTLHPESDGRFTIIGVANFDGSPSVPEVQVGDHLLAVDGIPVLHSTMGQVWSMLAGSPGQQRQLTIERGAKQFTVAADVRHFLAAAPDQDETKSKRKRD